MTPEQSNDFAEVVFGISRGEFMPNTKQTAEILAAALATLEPEPAAPKTLTDDQIDRIAENCAKSMDGGIAGFCKTWGYRQFARELLDVCTGYVREPAAPVEPATYKLVPMNPTPAMQKDGAMEIAMNYQRVQTAERAASLVYRAMLAASPLLKAEGDQS